MESPEILANLKSLSSPKRFRVWFDKIPKLSLIRRPEIDHSVKMRLMGTWSGKGGRP